MHKAQAITKSRKLTMLHKVKNESKTITNAYVRSTTATLVNSKTKVPTNNWVANDVTITRVQFNVVNCVAIQVAQWAQNAKYKSAARSMVTSFMWQELGARNSISGWYATERNHF